MGRLCRYQKLKNEELQLDHTAGNPHFIKNNKNTNKVDNGTIASFQEVCLHNINFLLSVLRMLMSSLDE